MWAGTTEGCAAIPCRSPLLDTPGPCIVLGYVADYRFVIGVVGAVVNGESKAKMILEFLQHLFRLSKVSSEIVKRRIRIFPPMSHRVPVSQNVVQ